MQREGAGFERGVFARERVLQRGGLNPHPSGFERGVARVHELDAGVAVEQQPLAVVELEEGAARVVGDDFGARDEAQRVVEGGRRVARFGERHARADALDLPDRLGQAMVVVTRDERDEGPEGQ